MARASTIRITIILTTKDHRAFVTASRQLRRVMGAKAPTTLDLLLHHLTERTARGIADDYLDFVDWPAIAESDENECDDNRARPRGPRPARLFGPKLTLDPSRN